MNNSSTNFASLQALDFGSGKPTSVPMETIEVEISTENLLGSFAKAFVNECYRKNPLRAEQVDLTFDEMTRYCHFLITKRVEFIHGNCSDFRKLKALYIPVWIQYNMALIGEVTVREYGLRMVPVIPEDAESSMTLAEALEISNKVGYFIDDLQIVQDAFPRTIGGDKDVMSTAIIAGYVRAIQPVQHVSSTYVTRFLDMKLNESIAMAALYRVQYDDAEFIASALLNSRGIF